MTAKRIPTYATMALVALALLGAFLLIRHQSDRRDRLDSAKAQLQAILDNVEATSNRPAPGNQIRTLLADAHGRELLIELDEAQERLAFDPSTDAYLCIWNGPGDEQVLFLHPGANPGEDLIVGLPTQVTIEKVQIGNGEATFWFGVSSAAEDEDAVARIIGLEPGKLYELAIDIADLSDADFIKIWRSAIPQNNGDTETTNK